jgi:hypothetical protein
MSHIRVNTSNAKVRHRMERERERTTILLSRVVRNYIHVQSFRKSMGFHPSPPFRRPFKTNFFKGSLAAA